MSVRPERISPDIIPRLRPHRSEISTWVGAPFKWVVDPLFERFSAGAAWSASDNVTHGGRAVQTLYVPATWWATERLWVHANFGADWSQFRARTVRRGVSAESAATVALTPIAERITLSGERTLRLGVRWSFTKSINVDLSVARVRNHGPQVFAPDSTTSSRAERAEPRQNNFANTQYSEPDSSIATGSVSTQAIARFRIVDICRPDRLAAIVPATPDERTCVVETGRP